MKKFIINSLKDIAISVLIILGYFGPFLLRDVFQLI